MTRSAVRSRLAPPAFAGCACFGSASPIARRLPRRSPKGDDGLYPALPSLRRAVPCSTSPVRLPSRTPRPRQTCFRPLVQPPGPAPEHFCHAVGLNTELNHRPAPVDGLAGLGDQGTLLD